MTHTDFRELLLRINACSEAVRWADGKSLQEAWDSCDRVDWLLWLAARMMDMPGWHIHKQIVSAACDCAETALKLIPTYQSAPRKVIEVTRAWIADNASASAGAARVAYPPPPPIYAAAAIAAIAASRASFAHASQKETLKSLADVVRKALPTPTGEQE
jgi:hypothetical protein